MRLVSQVAEVSTGRAEVEPLFSRKVTYTPPLLFRFVRVYLPCAFPKNPSLFFI